MLDQKDLDQIRKIMKEEVVPVKKDLKKLKKDVKTIVSYFDHHLGLTA